MSKKIKCWEELSNNKTPDYEIKLIPADFGVVAEYVGVRTLIKILASKENLNKFYPNVKTLQYKKINGDWDYGIEIHYRKNKEYGKKILIFEIKHGKNIGHKQMHKYSDMVIDPKKYFPEADEVKVFYMIFENLDTLNRKATYHFCELEQTIAKKDIRNC